MAKQIKNFLKEKRKKLDYPILEIEIRRNLLKIITKLNVPQASLEK